ncbi:hypothetical protein GEMRC1_012287 [Eukaryota sp. GEM-RC1]
MSFCGADFQNQLLFSDVFPQLTTLYLTVNFRSSPPVVKLANSILTKFKIFNNSSSPQLIPCYVNNERSFPPPSLVLLFGEVREALFVAEKINKIKQRSSVVSNIGVLFRVSRHSWILELVFNLYGIFYNKISGQQFKDTACGLFLSSLIVLLDFFENSVSSLIVQNFQLFTVESSWQILISHIPKLSEDKKTCLLNRLRASRWIPSIDNKTIDDDLLVYMKCFSKVKRQCSQKVHFSKTFVLFLNICHKLKLKICCQNCTLFLIFQP